MHKGSEKHTQQDQYADDEYDDRDGSKQTADPTHDDREEKDDHYDDNDERKGIHFMSSLTVLF
ncbi:hypothetical protein [Salicibibacter kimchii]|uniref:Uncharacterized protein n=1 Tax=Salicibibacter kimchii TaxID=2099786 RepID=A0A345C1S5_9BACI|nr:hypothetical protein [Salicibibacter kimchii]AXF57156.1 hypothetical protein DT065_14900 [Salicibibacter kimchii]